MCSARSRAALVVGEPRRPGWRWSRGMYQAMKNSLGSPSMSMIGGIRRTAARRRFARRSGPRASAGTSRRPDAAPGTTSVVLMAWALCDPGFAAGPGRAQAQQPDDIGAVAAGSPGVGWCGTSALWRRWQSLVPDVGEHVGVAVLPDGLAEQPTQAEVGAPRSGLRSTSSMGKPPQPPDESRPHGQQFTPPVHGGAEQSGQFGYSPRRPCAARASGCSRTGRTTTAPGRESPAVSTLEGPAAPTVRPTIRSTRPALVTGSTGSEPKNVSESASTV